MTREKQIYDAAAEYGCKDESAEVIDFVEGAMWADVHPHWISVEDELPQLTREIDFDGETIPASDEVIILVEHILNKQMKMIGFIIPIDEDEKEFYWVNSELASLNDTDIDVFIGQPYSACKVTHWMPMPPAPKKGGEE